MFKPTNSSAHYFVFGVAQEQCLAMFLNRPDLGTQHLEYLISQRACMFLTHVHMLTVIQGQIYTPTMTGSGSVPSHMQSFCYLKGNIFHALIPILNLSGTFTAEYNTGLESGVVESGLQEPDHLHFQLHESLLLYII